MKGLIYSSIGGFRFTGDPRNGIFAEFAPPSDRPYIRVACSKPRRRNDLPRAVFRALLVGRDLLLVLWATSVLAIFVTVFAGFVR